MTISIQQLPEETIEAYKQAKNRLLLLDYDGTLVNFVDNPKAARPSPEVTGCLKALAVDSKNQVVVVSGRDKQILDTWLGGLNVSLAAEHGAFVKTGGKWSEAGEVSAKWQDSIIPSLEAAVARVSGTFIEHKQTALVWHYRGAADKTTAKRVAQELIRKLGPIAQRLGIKVVPEAMAVEARPATFDKGQATKFWLKDKVFDFILCAGDSATDEDMFKIMPSKAVTLKVGHSQTAAKYSVASPAELLGLLAQFQHKL